MSNFQSVSRDFAFVVDEDVAASDLLKAVKSAAGSILSDIQLFDLYQGEGVGEGKKSLAITVTLTPRKATLTEDEIESISADVIAFAEKKCGAILRS